MRLNIRVMVCDGLDAVCVHALRAYPFQRPELCGLVVGDAGDKNLLRVGDKLQPVCVVTVEMREKHQVQLGRLYAKRGQLLVDRRAFSKRP